MIIKHAFLYVMLLTTTSFLHAGEFLTSEQIKNILEAESKSQAELSAAKRVYFCWSKPDHPKRVHGYEQFARTFASQLSAVESVQATTIEGYPTREQWESADLVVFNLTQSNLSSEQYAAMDSHLNQGGSVIVVHQGLVQRTGYEEWAKRIGLAFSWGARESRSKWGKGELEISLDTRHAIFRGFPETIRVEDELYWNLKAGNQGKVSILGETPAPKKTRASASDANTTKWPAFWTVEHSAKDGAKAGRVFCCVISHPDEVVFSSSFQIVMMRAFAWCLGEPASPFLQNIAP